SMRRATVIFLASASALLGACGGGSGGGPISTPPPAPGPTPSPTPAPTPTPTPPPTTVYTPPEVERPAPPYSLEPTTTGTLAEALESPQDFRTGAMQVEWDRVDGWLSTRNSRYGYDQNLRFSTKPDGEGVYTVYNAPGG